MAAVVVVAVVVSSTEEDSGLVVIGSRRSRLARLQARAVGERLQRTRPDVRIEYAFLTTEGDRVLDRPLPEIGGKGLFTAELETGLRTGALDLAVHSLKDLPTAAPPDLELVCVPEREDPRDVLVSASGAAGLAGLPEGAVVGTSSLRRTAQLLRARPDCRPRAIRGNVETRLRKLEEGLYDALVLAAAGLHRLDAVPDGTVMLDPESWLPAPAQGALGVQGRPSDDRVRELTAAIDAPGPRARVTAERAFLAALEGDCRVPIGALARLEGETLTLRGAVFSPDGSEAVSGERRGPVQEAERVGRELGRDLRDSGAESILAGLRARGRP